MSSPEVPVNEAILGTPRVRGNRSAMSGYSRRRVYVVLLLAHSNGLKCPGAETGQICDEQWLVGRSNCYWSSTDERERAKRCLCELKEDALGKTGHYSPKRTKRSFAVDSVRGS